VAEFLNDTSVERHESMIAIAVAQGALKAQCQLKFE